MALPTIVGVSAAAASGTGAVTPAFPVGYTAVVNDILLTIYEIGSADTLTPPSGWASVTQVTVSTGTTTRLGAIWKRVVGGETAPSISDPGTHIIARMIVVRGCVTTGNPWDIAPTTTELVADTTVSIIGGTTTVADCLVLATFATGQDVTATSGATAWANASLGSVTEQMDNWTLSGGGFAMATGTKAVAGVVSATTATLSLTANFKALMMIALKGAVAAAAPIPALITAPSRR